MNDSQTCPICALPVPTPDSDAPLPEGFPFCSKRCRLIDLGKWFDGAYKVSRPFDDEGTDSA